jgi:hypothetical protein
MFEIRLIDITPRGPKMFSSNPLLQEVSMSKTTSHKVLSATLAKWIFKLIDPRHLASWKSLPFYFFNDHCPGLGSSIFLAAPIITKSFWH